jgi:hypothetical protein
MQIMHDVSIVRPPPNYRNNCWHTAATIMWQWRQRVDDFQGPMGTIAARFDSDRTMDIPSADFTEFVDMVGLAALASPSHDFRSEEIRRVLLRHGPLMCIGRFYAPNPESKHIIVLIGVDTDAHRVFYVDSEPPHERKSASIVWFNHQLDTHLQRAPGFDCIYHLDPARRR